MIMNWSVSLKWGIGATAASSSIASFRLLQQKMARQGGAHRYQAGYSAFNPP
eukprot:CAMPEP_0171090600 /NCGR_PEP_ID=MMETSP0766_2-20121228/31961_1 /TAXON_ID=439317 /ORGANISM="Gambierdiscus australes, Strain CAWD 149" /LENGTH=51 /DNA_ID=CAMNT_0011548613 /DNA_START=353 /DNA_END=504 /DNA_ORIENTATION=+